MASPRKHPDAFRAALALAACLALAGCGDRFHSVEGRVTLDGRPVADAAVMFEPAAGGPVPSGVTDADGRFRLITGSRSGAPPGDYRVTVAKERLAGVRPDETVEPGGPRVEHLVPERYGKAATSGLRVTVPSAAYDLALTSP